MQVTYVAPPVYRVECVTQSAQQGEALAVVQNAVTAIQTTINRFSGGKFQIRHEVCITINE